MSSYNSTHKTFERDRQHRAYKQAQKKGADASRKFQSSGNDPPEERLEYVRDVIRWTGEEVRLRRDFDYCWYKGSHKGIVNEILSKTKHLARLESSMEDIWLDYLKTAENGVLTRDLGDHPITAVLTRDSNSAECRKTALDALDDLTTYLSQFTNDDGELIITQNDQDAQSASDLREDENLAFADIYDRKFNASTPSLDEQEIGSKTLYEIKEELKQEKENEGLERERQNEFRQSTEESDIQESEQSHNTRTNGVTVSDRDWRVLCNKRSRSKRRR